MQDKPRSDRNFAVNSKKVIFTAILAILGAFVLPQPAFASTPSEQKKIQIIDNAREFLFVQKPFLAYADAPFLALHKNKFSTGSNAADLLLDLLYPTSGRTQYVQYVPQFGKNKMYWRKLDWEKYETDHISLFVYDPELRDLFISLVEENYTDLAKTFETESFDEKLRIYIYRDRRDFRQMNFGGIDSDGVLGVTHDLRSWHNKIAFLFEGSKSDLFEVSRHEMVHRFNMEQIYHQSGADMAGNPPLWFVEGLAVSYSIGWSAVHEWVARDAYYNGYLEYGIWPEGEGTFLPYVTGAMVVNYIKANYGTETINEIIKESAVLAKKKLTSRAKFDKILKKYTEHNTYGLYEHAVEDFEKHLEKSDDDIDAASLFLSYGRILATRDNMAIKIEYKDLRYRLSLLKIEDGSVAQEKKIVADGKNSAEAIEFAAALSDTHLAYVAFQSQEGTDVLRYAPYSLNKKNKIKIGKFKEFHSPDIIFVKSPVFIGANQIAFVGIKDGLANIFLLNLKTEKLEQLTNGASDIAGIDYSIERNELVFSRESEERTANPNKCDFNYDLFLLNLKTREEKRVVETLNDETSPQWIDAGRIVFTTDAFGTYGISIYDLNAGRFLPVSAPRVSATNPKALDKDTIIFHTTEYLESKALLFKLGAEPANTSANAPSGAENKALEEKIGNVVVKDGKLFVADKDGLHAVKKFAVSGGNLYFDAETKPGTTILVPFTKEPSADAVSESITDALTDKFRQENTVMWEEVSPSGNFAAFAVNNRLNWKDKKKTKKHAVSVHLYNAKVKKFIAKYDFAIKTTNEFYAAMFVGNDYLLLNISDKFILINAATNKMEQVKTGSAKISPDKKFVAWTEKKSYFADPKLFILDAQNGKTVAVEESREFNNLHFTGNNELAWAETVKTHSKNLVTRICVWNAEAGLKTITIKVGKKSVLNIKEKEIIDFEASGAGRAVILIQNHLNEKKELYLVGADGAKYLPLTIQSVDIERILDASLFFAGKVNKKSKSFILDLETEKVTERIKPEKSATNGKQIVISTADSLTLFDATDGQNRQMPETKGFDLKNNQLIFSRWTGTNYDVFKTKLDIVYPFNVTKTPEKDETYPYFDGAKNEVKFSAKSVKNGEKVAYIPPPPPPKYAEGKVKKDKINKLPFANFDGFGMASVGFSNHQVRVFGYLNLTSYDLFEDGLMHVFFLGGYNTGYTTAEIAYTHQPSGNGAQIYFNNFFYDYTAATNYFHIFRINHYQRFVLGGGYKFQLLCNPYPVDYRGWGNVLEAFASYTIDTTLHQLHGPQDGFRLYIGARIGYNANENNLNNADANVAWRQYFNIKNMVSFAYRLEAGASLGIAPTWYGIGGNMTLRGLHYGSAWGNVYAIAGADVRFDLFYYAGAILKEPLTPASLFFLAIMPQFGWFVDVGTAFYWNPMVKPMFRNWDTPTTRHILEEIFYPPTLHWSTGPFVNLPYLPLGMILRFNWSVAGTDKVWNFWFGFNW